MDLKTASKSDLSKLTGNIDAVTAFFSLHYYHTNPNLYLMLASLNQNAVFISIIVNRDSLLKILDKDSLSYKSKNYEYKVLNNQLHIRLPFSDDLMVEDFVDMT
jgi:hypothetical protein